MAGLLCMAVISVNSADLKVHHLSARPLDNVTTTAADRDFITDMATDIIRQIAAAEAAAQFAPSTEFVEAAHLSRDTLEVIYRDLKDLARLKGVAVPLEGSVPRDLQKVIDSRPGPIEREYERYAERNSLRMLERFYDASRKAEDRQVRSFALRYLRPIYRNYEVAKALDASSTKTTAETPPKIGVGRVAEMPQSPTTTTNAPLTAAASSPPVP